MHLCNCMHVLLKERRWTLLRVHAQTQAHVEGEHASDRVPAVAHLAPSVGVAVGERDLQQHDGGQLDGGTCEACVQLILQLKCPPAALRKHMVDCGRVVLHLHGDELRQPLCTGVLTHHACMHIE